VTTTNPPSLTFAHPEQIATPSGIQIYVAGGLEVEEPKGCRFVFLLQSGLLYPSFNLHAHGNKRPLLHSINSHRLVLFAFLLASSTPSMFKSKPITNGCVNANEQKKQKKGCIAWPEKKERKEKNMISRSNME
jgi:hypothetical protein